MRKRNRKKAGQIEWKVFNFHKHKDLGEKRKFKKIKGWEYQCPLPGYEGIWDVQWLWAGENAQN